MVGALLIGAAVASAVLAAAALRLPSLVATLLAAYLALVANLGLTTLVLSPLHGVTRAGLGVAEAVLLVAAVGAWWARGRPGAAAAGARAAAAAVGRDPVLLAFLAFVLVLLAYELVLALAVPPNNGDALGYHLPKAAAWAQAACDPLDRRRADRADERVPAARRAAAPVPPRRDGRRSADRPAAVPRPARDPRRRVRRGAAARVRRPALVGRRRSCSRRSRCSRWRRRRHRTTSSRPRSRSSRRASSSAAGSLEAGLAGGAAGLAVGVKLTTLLVAPVLLWLALAARPPRRPGGARRHGRRLRRDRHVGLRAQRRPHGPHPRGRHARGREPRVAVVPAAASRTASTSRYGMIDVSVLWKGLIDALAVAAVAAGGAAWAWARRHRRRRRGARRRRRSRRPVPRAAARARRGGGRSRSSPTAGASRSAAPAACSRPSTRT